MSCSNCNSSGFPISIQNVQSIYSPSSCAPQNQCFTQPGDVKGLLYMGPDLACSTISTGMNMEEVVQRLNDKICTVLGDFSTYDVACLSSGGPITTQQAFVEKISEFVCDLSDDFTTFKDTTFETYKTEVDERFDLIEIPGITSTVSSIVDTDDLQTVLTKLADKITDIQNVKLNLSSVVWNNCFVVGSTPTSIAAGFSLLAAQICSLKTDMTNQGITMPTFNNVGSCLGGTLTTADTLTDTVNKIKTRLCLSPTFDINTLAWGCTAKPSVVTTDLQAAFQAVLTQLSTIKQNFPVFSGDFTSALVNPSDPCQGKTISLVAPGGGGGGDRYVAINVGDTSPGTLSAKLTQGTNIILDTTTVPGQMIINSTATGLNDKVKTRNVDPSAGYLEDKVEGSVNSSTGVTITSTTNVSNNKVTIGSTINASKLWEYLLDSLASDPDTKAIFCEQVTSCLPDCIIPPNVTVIYDTTNDVPAPPTSGVVDDTANTFNWTNNPSFTSLTEYEKTIDGGLTYSAVSAKPITGLTGSIAIGMVGVRVKAIGSNPHSSTLFNSTAYTP